METHVDSVNILNDIPDKGSRTDLAHLPKDDREDELTNTNELTTITIGGSHTPMPINISDARRAAMKLCPRVSLVPADLLSSGNRRNPGWMGMEWQAGVCESFCLEVVGVLDLRASRNESSRSKPSTAAMVMGRQPKSVIKDMR